jgi:sporulation protein YlmC with PRC-barrel domain
MTKFTYATAAAAFLLLGSSAYAQDAATTPDAAKPAVVCPEKGTVDEATLPPECKTDALSTQSTTPPAADATAGAAPAAQPDATATQPEATATASAPPVDGILASQFMGQTVYTAANESVGEINDVVMTKSLDNTVAVVGVGGFLGIGQKDVAIPINDIKVEKDANNALHLTIASTKEQLDAMPGFDRTAMK